MRNDRSADLYNVVQKSGKGSIKSGRKYGKKENSLKCWTNI
jgi:hypothetical protein